MAAQNRSLTQAEGSQLQRTLRQSHDAVAVRRAPAVLRFEQGSTVQEIAEQTLLHEEYVRGADPTVQPTESSHAQRAPQELPSDGADISCRNRCNRLSSRFARETKAAVPYGRTI